MVWGHAYFSGGGREEEDEDMTYPVDYFIGGDWAPQPWSSKISDLSWCSFIALY